MSTKVRKGDRIRLTETVVREGTVIYVGNAPSEKFDWLADDGAYSPSFGYENEKRTVEILPPEWRVGDVILSGDIQLQRVATHAGLLGWISTSGTDHVDVGVNGDYRRGLVTLVLRDGEPVTT